MGPKMAQNGAIAEGGSQETKRGTRASRGLYGGHKKTGDDSPILEMEDQPRVGLDPAQPLAGEDRPGMTCCW